MQIDATKGRAEKQFLVHLPHRGAVGDKMKTTEKTMKPSTNLTTDNWMEIRTTHQVNA